MPLSKSKKTPTRKARDVLPSKSKKAPARNVRNVPKADYKRYMPVQERVQYLTIAEIPLMTSQAVHPALWLELTPELHKKRRETFIEHKRKLAAAIQKDSITPLNAATKKAETPFNDESLVERRQVETFASTLGIKMKPMLEVTVPPRPLEVEPALLAIPRTELILYHYKFGGLNASGIGAAGDYIDEFNARKKRQAEGFFTLEEAAQVLADENSVGVNVMISEIRKAEIKNTGTDKLQPLTRDGNRFPIDTTGQKVADYETLVTVSDIVIWLASSKTGYRWPAASAESKQGEVADTTKPRPLQQQLFQETKILCVMGKLGYTVMAMPKNKPGKPGVKAAVREKLQFSVRIFDKAWERLLVNKEIAYATK